MARRLGTRECGRLDIGRVAVFSGLMLALSGCGLRGDLERPAPLFGGTDNREAEAAEDTAEAAERAARARAAGQADAAEARARKTEAQQ